jgi:hypothetical protein
VSIGFRLNRKGELHQKARKGFSKDSYCLMEMRMPASRPNVNPKIRENDPIGNIP